MFVIDVKINCFSGVDYHSTRWAFVLLPNIKMLISHVFFEALLPFNNFATNCAHETRMCLSTIGLEEGFKVLWRTCNRRGQSQFLYLLIKNLTFSYV